MSPENKYPASKEDIDTIITGPDGKDYVVDIVDGEKKWVLYLPEPDDLILIHKVLPSINNDNEENQKPTLTIKKPNKYQIFISEMTKKIKEEQPKLPATERRKLVQQLWKDQH